jgi:hypothetical protein
VVVGGVLVAETNVGVEGVGNDHADEGLETVDLTVLALYAGAPAGWGLVGGSGELRRAMCFFRFVIEIWASG